MPCVKKEKDAKPDFTTKVKYLFTTIGTLTERGGRITKVTRGVMLKQLMRRGA